MKGLWANAGDPGGQLLDGLHALPDPGPEPSSSGASVTVHSLPGPFGIQRAPGGCVGFGVASVLLGEREGGERKFMGWALPGADRFSVLPIFISRLLPVWLDLKIMKFP